MITVQLISDIGYFWTKGVLYMFSKEKFNWSASRYSNYAATSSLIRAFGILVIFPTFKRALMGDAMICALGSISNLLSFYVFGIAWMPWVLWMAAALGCIGSISAVTRYIAESTIYLLLYVYMYFGFPQGSGIKIVRKRRDW